MSNTDSNTKAVEKTEKKDAKIELKSRIKELNQHFLQNKLILILSIPISIVAFVTAYYVPFESSWIHWLQTLLFLISAGCLVIVLTVLFNGIWLLITPSKEAKNKEIKE